MGVVRLRRRYNPVTREMEDVPLDAPRDSGAPFVWDDLPGYESPVSGLWVEGRRARREDLKRTGCRPWEGLEQERKEAARAEQRTAAKIDQIAERLAHQAWAQAPTRIRKILRGE
jgi:hypothetical protein